MVPSDTNNIENNSKKIESEDDVNSDTSGKDLINNSTEIIKNDNITIHGSKHIEKDEVSDDFSITSTTFLHCDSESAYIHESLFLEHRKVGKYHITKSLGKGSSGRVKLGVCLETGEKVAIKIVKRDSELNCKESSKDEGLKPSSGDIKETIKRREERIFREVLISSLLCHPHIVRLNNFYYNENFFYLIFEYVAGEQLLDLIINNGPLKEIDARRYFRQILSAVSYIHENNVVHRDLKIENALVDEDGNIKILDFGLSNFFDNKRFLKTFCGSLYFAAPELLMGQKYHGPEIDIWSMGIILYVLIYGKVPFDDRNISILHSKIKSAKLKFSSETSSELRNLLSSMICTDPLSRMSLYAIIESPWVNEGYKTPVNNFLSNRFLLPRINNKLLHVLERVFVHQFPTLKNDVLAYSKVCKRIYSSDSITPEGRPHGYETSLWMNKPAITIYYLFYENFVLTHNDEWLKLKDDEQDSPITNLYKNKLESSFEFQNRRAEDAHNFVNFLFAKEKENIFSKYFLGSVLKEQQDGSEISLEMDKSTENFFRNERIKNKDLNKTKDESETKIEQEIPKLKRSFIKGIFKGILLKDMVTHTKLRNLLRFHFLKNNIIYEATDRNYLCSLYSGSNYCSFKISLYINTILNKYYLSVTRITGNKNSYREMIKGLRNFCGNWMQIDEENALTC